jgi:hypothetical protein
MCTGSRTPTSNRGQNVQRSGKGRTNTRFPIAAVSLATLLIIAGRLFAAPLVVGLNAVAPAPICGQQIGQMRA